jgi:hypothetical protein
VAIVTDDEWATLVRDLVRRVEVFAPDWTDHEASDPGITLLELFAYLGEALLDRPGRSEAELTRLGVVVDELHGLIRHRAGLDAPSLTRVRYFDGQVLSAGDLELEQAYLRDKHRRHNRLLHGTGIVHGLAVAVEPAPADGEALVTVAPGLAIAPDGEELVVGARLTIRLPAHRSSGFVTLGLVDRLLDPVPTRDGEEASRVAEIVEAALVTDVPASYLAIARVERTDHGWRVDPAFEASRPRP